MLPEGWRPPTAFPVVMHFRDGRAETLWVTPYLLFPGGRARYLATGRQGTRLDWTTIAAVDNRLVPDRVMVSVVTETHDLGYEVFAQLNHTAN